MGKDALLLAPIDEVTAAEIRSQVERMTTSPLFVSSKRSSAFLKFVVDEALRGAGESLKERTIGVEVFGRSPSYDTNVDHVVRTAALELRKRLTIYYSDAQHESEVRISLVPGSYLPHFATPEDASPKKLQPTTDEAARVATEDPHAVRPISDTIATEKTALQSETRPNTQRAGAGRRWILTTLASLTLAACIVCLWYFHRRDPERQFWGPLVEGSGGPVLIAVGTARNGLPESGRATDGATIVIPSPADRRYIPYADALVTAEVVSEFRMLGKRVEIRRSMDASFSDLREMPMVLVGAFDNPWSLRLMSGLRFSMQVDGSTHAVYIRDAKNPTSRAWEWKNNPIGGVAGGVGSGVIHDYALISRVRDVATGRMVVLIAGLEPYGTQAAGEFVADPEQLKALDGIVSISSSRNLQIVLETTVTDGTPGIAHVVASWQE